VATHAIGTTHRYPSVVRDGEQSDRDGVGEGQCEDELAMRRAHGITIAHDVIAQIRASPSAARCRRRAVG
jgi:hypothetical protein